MRWAVLLALGLAGCARAGFEGPDGALRDGEASPGDHAVITDALRVDQPGIGDGPRPDQPPASLDGPVAGSGVIVPLYVDPPHNTWTALAQAKLAHPTVEVVAVANVETGPGKRSHDYYHTGIAALTQAGVVVIGYVWTEYGSRSQSAVKQEIDSWSAWYAPSGLKGIFFDGQATAAGLEPYYQSLSAYAKAKGLSFTVGDPGVDPPPSYVGTVDTLVIYQNAGLPEPASLGGWHTAHDKKNFAILAYEVPQLDKSFVAAAKQYVGYIYVTDDTLPDPWNTLPSYLDALLAALEP